MEGSTLSLFSTQDLGLECNNEFQDLGPEINIAFRTQVLNAIMVSQDPGFWDLGPECINGYFALRAQVLNTIMLIEGLGPEHNYGHSRPRS